MPKHEPDLEDPLSLEAASCDDPTGLSVQLMAEAFAEEFLRLGHTSAEVMDMFRSEDHSLAHHAWEQLGEVRLFALIGELAAERAQFQAAVARARGGHHA
jgi:hypothetical protein